MTKLLAALLFVVLFPLSAFAIGEVFKVETSGTEYCGDFDVQKFNANNNIDLWVFIVSEDEIIVSFTPDFAEGTYFPMGGGTYLTGAKTAAFVAGVLFENGSYATIQGTAKADKFGGVGSLSGTFVQSEVFNLGCFSSGKFKTTERLL